MAGPRPARPAVRYVAPSLNPLFFHPVASSGGSSSLLRGHRTPAAPISAKGTLVCMPAQELTNTDLPQLEEGWSCRWTALMAGRGSSEIALGGSVFETGDCSDELMIFQLAGRFGTYSEAVVYQNGTSDKPVSFSSHDWLPSPLSCSLSCIDPIKVWPPRLRQRPHPY